MHAPVYIEIVTKFHGHLHLQLLADVQQTFNLRTHLLVYVHVHGWLYLWTLSSILHLANVCSYKLTICYTTPIYRKLCVLKLRVC